jgi:uncharacterized protein (TIGR03067 family)
VGADEGEEVEGTAMKTASVATVLILVTFAPAAQKPKDDKAQAAELKKLEGKWEVESTTLYGRETAKSDPPTVYEIKGSVLTVVATGAMWRIGLDASADPKRMTQTEVEAVKDGLPVPKEGGQVNRCVYELKGDKLKFVVWRGVKDEFPKSITPEEGEPVLVMTLTRPKK